MSKHKTEIPRKAEPNFEAIFSALPGSFLVLSPEFKLVSISDELAKATLTKPEEILGRYVFDVLPDDPSNPSGFKIWKQSLKRVLETGKLDLMPVVKYSVRKSTDEPTEYLEKYWRPANYPVLGIDGKVEYIIHRTEEITELQETIEENLEAQQKSKNARTRMEFALKAAEMGDWELNLITGEAYRSFKHDQCFGYNAPQEIWTLDHALRHVHPDDLDMVEKAHRDAIAGKGDMNLECRIIWPDGSLHWITARARLEKDKLGKPIRLAGLVWETTNEKLESEQLKQLADSISQLAWMANPDGNIYWYNKRWFDYTGTTLDQMVGWGWKAVHHPDHLDRVVRKVADFWARDWKESEAWEDTFPLKGADGQYRWFLSRMLPIKDNEGNVVRWFGTNTDVTEQILVQRRLEKAEQDARQLAAIAESSTDFIGMSDTALVPFYCNPAGRKLIGLDPDIDVSKIAILDCFPKELHERIQREVIPDLLQTGYWEGELVFQHFLTKELIPVLYNIFRIKDQVTDQLIAYGTVTRPISDRKKMELALLEAKEQAEAASQLKSSFLANMSHEIRTPLGAILGFTDLLKDRDLKNEERNQFLETISRNGKALTKIIDDILDLAKVESGKLEIEKTEFSFFDLIDDVMDLFRERTRAKSIYIRAHFERDIPGRIVSDPTRLRQILINIVGNAVKFTNEGGVTIDVTGKNLDEGKFSFEVFVKDTGVGMSPKERSRLFQPFMQADNTTTRKFGGTGLGLALSKRLATALGGDISIKDCELAKGCTFIISFLAWLPTAVQISIPNEALKSKKTALLSGVRILIADDSKDNLILVSRILTKQGAMVETASDGAQAFRMGMAGSYDVVLMDIQMPEMDGYEATRALREAGFKKPIIALTAHAMAEERARSFAAGCSGHLTKPLNQTELVETIQANITNKSYESSLRKGH